MTPEELETNMIQLPAEVEAVIKNIRMDIGKMAVDHYKENFEKEGFVEFQFHFGAIGDQLSFVLIQKKVSKKKSRLQENGLSVRPSG